MAPDSAARTREAFARLQRALGDVSRLVESRIDERCPYRTAENACMFVGPCENKVADRSTLVPGGRDPRRGARAEDHTEIPGARCAGDRDLARRPA
jgi:hypothetical protein